MADIEWISVKNKMPETGQLIIAAAPDYFYKVYHYHPQCRWHSRKREDVGELKFEERFTHWMPLPLLPGDLN